MSFSSSDLDELRRRGLTPEDAARQIQLLRAPVFFPVLDRPCALNDGVLRLSPTEISNALRHFDRARQDGRLSKFIPSSGAATRMFRSLAAYRRTHSQVLRDRLEIEAAAGDPNAAETLSVVVGLASLPFFEDVRAHLQEKGHNPSVTLSSGDYTLWIDAMIAVDGMGLSGKPKALIPFHRVRSEVRTPLEEHLIESVDTLRDGQGVCRLHFTVSPEHESLFLDLFSRLAPRLQEKFRCRYDVSFSAQHPSTDTLALDIDGRPARRKDGRLLFRPGGHGALIKNLNDSAGDVVLVKNIDNVAHESHPGESSHWDAVLTGLLLELQSEIFRRLSWMTSRPQDERLLADSELFASERLSLRPPSGSARWSIDERRKWLMSRLDRPIRVCAVVKNEGEPGGGPFWLRGGDGDCSPQIIESSQVSEDLSQKKVAQSAHYFNPVHMVLGVRNAAGTPFDLNAFVDPRAVFVTEKSTEDGATLRVLERPGLWNGGMAQWTTVFVDAPLTTFHPVKTVVDLLRPDHQES